MKSLLKKIFIYTLVTLSAFFSVAYISCNNDKCKTIVCAYNGVCNQGACICPSGYEGTNCETKSYFKFLGNWTVFEKGSTTDAAQYHINIQQIDSNISMISIINFNSYFTSPITAYVSGDTITIPNQELQGKVVFGVGYIYSTTTYGQFSAISMKYEVIDTATGRIDDFGYYAPDLSSPSIWNK